MIPEIINNKIWDFIIKKNSDGISKGEKYLSKNNFATIYDMALDVLQPSDIGKMTEWFMSMGMNPIVDNTYTELGVPDSYLYGSKRTSFDIPDKVKCIGETAFGKCVNLERVTIPSSVTKIEAYAFWSCPKLKTIVIPDSVTNMGGYTFADSGVEDITLSGSCPLVPAACFKNCTQLRKIVLPSCVNHVSANAFINNHKDLVIWYDGKNTKLAALLHGYGLKAIGIN